MSANVPSRDDAFLREASCRFGDVLACVQELARGHLVFDSTETWRTLYESILSTCETKRYLSVALIQTDGYWRDATGRASIEFNYHLVEHGFYIHRLFLIDQYFWPPGSPLPDKELLGWIQSQFVRGIEVGLIRLGDIENESHLIRDMGIYGRRVVGYQTGDAVGKTARFELRFDAHSLRTAEQCWEQLRLYEFSLNRLLDRPH